MKHKVEARPFLTAEWRNLAMLNYEVDPSLVLSRVPAGTQLDSWQGKTFVSLVAFQFLDTRVRGVAVPFHRNFEELNLRFYVKRHADDGVRRGVVFIREIVPRRAIALVARLAYNENYLSFPMTHRIERHPPDEPRQVSVEYAWRSGGRRNRLGLETTGPPAMPAVGSIEQFIAEHYWGYVTRKGGGSLEYRVDHPAWEVWQSSAARLDADMSEIYGPEFVAPLSKPPDSAFLAEGSAVAVWPGKPLV